MSLRLMASLVLKTTVTLLNVLTFQLKSAMESGYQIVVFADAVHFAKDI